MDQLRKHITASLIAGFVAILPVGGMVLTVGYLESTISESGLAALPFYFPGLGLIVALVLIYLVGVLVNTLVGRWLWKRLDMLLDNMPVLGGLYQTLKQILGYGKGKDAVFHEAVLVPGKEPGSEELGLVTNRITDEAGKTRLVIFVPGAPNPTSGRLLIMEGDAVKTLSMSANETLKALVSMGKTDIRLTTHS